MTSRVPRAAATRYAPPGLPGRDDPRWRWAPRLSDGTPTAYLPFRPPYVPHTGSRLRWLRSATHFVLLADGFPGRVRDGHLLLHPLDGRYLLEALLAAQVERPRRKLHGSIARTAYAIVGRAEPLNEALVLRYVDTASSMAGGEAHVSGLAQAYYATALTRAAMLLGDDRLQADADRFFAALLMRVPDGGALYRTGHDTALALVPTRPRDLILNGWLSMLTALHAYAELRDSLPARELFDANVRTLRRLLPLYDVPALRLSRYGLTGPLLLRLVFSGGTVDDIRLSGLRIAIPGEGEVRLPSRPGGRWTPRTYPQDAAVTTTPSGRETLIPHGNGVRLVAILSRAGHPRRNRLRLRLATSRPVSVTTTAHIGRYDPMTSATVDRKWIELDARVVNAGSHDLDIELPYGPIDLFAYPTNFTRGGPGQKVNTYHGTHIVRLRQLARMTGEPELAEWADRWMDYVRDWPKQPELAGGRCWSPEGALE